MDLTLDYLPKFEIPIYQYRRGFRAGSDALLLASHLPVLPQHPTIAELGAAHGPVILSIAKQIQDAEFIAVERQPELVALLKKNIKLNKLERFCLINGDLRDRNILPPHAADLVVMNPPYRSPDTGQQSPDPIRRAAHFEHFGTITDFLVAANYIAKPGAFVKVILPPHRLKEIFSFAESSDLAPYSMRPIFPDDSHCAYLCDVLMKRNSSHEFEILPPTFVR